MKKLLFVMLSFLVGTGAMAGEKDKYFTFNAGFLFNSTLNATLGYEHELTYGNAVELTAEIGNRWQRDPVCGKICKDVFWKGYYWDGGLLYKHCLKKFKNSNLRLRFGPEFGAYKGDYFFAVEGGLEYNYVFPSGVQLSLIQKNQVNFLHGDSFRNGLLIGLKIPF